MIQATPNMLAPDPFTAANLTGPQRMRTLGNLLRAELMGHGRTVHPFVERMRKAAFDNFNISRDDYFRKALVHHLAGQLPRKSMRVIARRGSNITQFCYSEFPGRLMGEPIDPTAWARSSARRIALCQQHIMAAFDQDYAKDGLQAEIKEIAAAWAVEMEKIYAEIAAFHQAHRPNWEESDQQGPDGGYDMNSQMALDFCYDNPPGP